MGSQDLFDQRRAGARQADDKYRPGSGTPQSRRPARKSGVKPAIIASMNREWRSGYISARAARAAARSRLAVSMIGAALVESVRVEDPPKTEVQRGAAQFIAERFLAEHWLDGLELMLG